MLDFSCALPFLTPWGGLEGIFFYQHFDEPESVAASQRGGFHSGRPVIMAAICLTENRHCKAAIADLQSVGDRPGVNVAVKWTYKSNGACQRITGAYVKDTYHSCSKARTKGNEPHNTAEHILKTIFVEALCNI
jgi:hypothetical protein